MACQRVYIVDAIHLSTVMQTAFYNEAHVSIG